MNKREDRCLLRIHLGEDDRVSGRARYERIVEAARDAGLAGATVLRGPLGFGHSSQIHTARILRLSTDLPVVVEMIDTEEALDAFLVSAAALLRPTLVTIEQVQLVRFGEDEDTENGPPR
ncbi:MAG: DUF190 domain-containing protein [Pseudomonadota bacterium]